MNRRSSGSSVSFAIAAMIRRGANSADACCKADRTSSTEHRLPCRWKQSTNRPIRCSVAASSLIRVFPRSKKSQRIARPGGSKEDADVLGRQYVLVEDHFAAGDLPGAGDAPQDIPPGADV